MTENLGDLGKQRHDLAREISRLQKNLNQLNEKKEFWFKKKEDLKQDIKKHINEIKEIKLKTDDSNILIVETKKERDKYNDQVSKIIDEITKLNKEKKEIFEKYKITEDPYEVQKKIEYIEKKLEIETSFENEKKLMKKLNQLKAIYKESKIRELIEKMDKLNKELMDSKKKSQELHKKIIQTAADTNGYAVFIDVSRKINDLRKEQEDAFNKFIEHKKEFLNVNNQLKMFLKQANQIEGNLNKIRTDTEIKKQESIKEILQRKTNTVLEKLKRKKRLDTQDLIILQGEHK